MMRRHGAGCCVACGGRVVACVVVAILAVVLALLGTGVQTVWATDAEPSAPAFDGRLGGNQGILPVGLSAENATATSISRLASADVELNGSLVTFRGEAVGEPINSSVTGSKWVVLQAGTSSVSSIQVLMTNDQVALIENFGAYKMRGSTLQVTGIYRVADPSQTGELDVTAYVVNVVDSGGPIEEVVDLRKLRLGIALVVVGIALIGLRMYLRWRSRS